MGSIFGGGASQGRGGLQSYQAGPAPREFAGEQLGGMQDEYLQRMLGFAGDMGDLKLDLTNRAAEAAQQRANQQNWKENALSAAPPSQHGQMMSAARSSADARSYMQNQQLADAERTRMDLMFRSASEPNYGQYMGSSAQTFGHMLPAYQMHGIDVTGGRGTGWDQYAALAGAAPPPDPTKQAQANAMQMSQDRLRSAGYGGGSSGGSLG